MFLIDPLHNNPSVLFTLKSKEQRYSSTLEGLREGHSENVVHLTAARAFICH